MYVRLLDDVVDLHHRTVTEVLAGGLAPVWIRRGGIVELGRCWDCWE